MPKWLEIKDKNYDLKSDTNLSAKGDTVLLTIGSLISYNALSVALLTWPLMNWYDLTNPVRRLSRRKETFTELYSTKSEDTLL